MRPLAGRGKALPRPFYDRNVPPLRAAGIACLFGLPSAAGVLAGCGHPAVVGSARVLGVALIEYRINPSRARASAGRLTLVVSNFGRLTHDLVISANSRSSVRLKPLAPGHTEQVTVQLSPGSYQMASTLSSDQALGILGTLTVTS